MCCDKNEALISTYESGLHVSYLCAHTAIVIATSQIVLRFINHSSAVFFFLHECGNHYRFI